MFAITGISGNLGGEVARNLLAAGRPVRAVMRDLCKSEAWAKRGCDLAGADINEAAALTAAFEGSEGVFVMVPPNFDPSPDFCEARTIAVTLSSALDAARPDKVVYLSTIGAQVTHSNLLSQHKIIERALQKLSLPITFLRPGWFMENSAWDVAPAKNGVISSFLQPLDKPVPMVATADIGRSAAELLQETSQGKKSGRRVVELEGPQRVTPNEIASTFAHLLGHPVRAEAVPRRTWESLFKSQGMRNPTRGFRCSMASMRDGSSSKVASVAPGREIQRCKLYCARSSNAKVSRDDSPGVADGKEMRSVFPQSDKSQTVEV